MENSDEKMGFGPFNKKTPKPTAELLADWFVYISDVLLDPVEFKKRTDEYDEWRKERLDRHGT